MKIRVLLLLAVAIAPAAATAQINIGGNRITLPNGKTIGMGSSHQDAKKLIAERKASFRTAMRRGEASFEKKNYGAAREATDSAKHLLTDKDDVERLVDLMQKLEVVGAAQLKANQKLLAEKKYKKYLRGLRRIAYQFGTLPCGQRARNRLIDAANDPNMQAGLQELKAAGLEQLVQQIVEGHFRARARSVKAKQPASSGGKDTEDTQARPGPTTMPAGRAERIKLMDAKKQARVVTLLQQIVKLFPHSAAAERARDDLDVLLADKAFVQKLAVAEAGRDAKRAFCKAENYHRAGLNAKAIKLYKEVIKKFPDTPQAKQAAEQIQTLRLQAAS